MGLIAWYPLNGNLKNYGIEDANLIQGTAPAYVNGKIGKSLSAGGAQWNAETTNRILNHDKLSFCFWWKNLSNDTDRSQIFGNDGMTTAMGGRKFSLFRYPTKNDLHWSWQEDGNLSNNTTKTSGVIKGILPDNEWVHICITYNNPTAKLYVNGKYYQTLTSAYNIQNCTFTWQTQVIHNSFSRNMNDLRFYDHCLSNEEIKQIYQCLILHYPLNSGYGSENLLVNTYEGYYGNGTVLTDETYNGFKIRYLKYEGTSYQDCIAKSSIISPTANTYYTVSFWAKGNCNILNFFFPSACINAISSDGHTSSAVDGCCVISLTPEWKRYWVTWKTRSDVSGAKNIVVGRIQNQGTGAECYIAGLKFEEGDKNSVWSPNEADDLYSQLGYNSTTVYDTSGFGNNAEKINTPIYTSDTVLYDSCINFNQSGYLKNTSLNLYANELTICFWVKMPNTITTQHFLFSTHNDWTYNGIGMWRDVSTQKGYYLLIKSNTETTFSRPFIGIDANTWTFISISYTGKQYSVYKNGSLYQTVDYGNDGQVYNPVLYLGNSLYNGTPSTETDEALMSDFRIYATALSAEDIKQLYQTKAKIDKNGNVYCNQFIESNNIGNLLDDYQYPVNSTTHSGVFSKVLVDCQDSITGKATKMTCNTAGLGFYIGGCWNTARSKFVNGKQYVWSMYVKSDNRTSITFNVECSSKQSKNTFIIDTNYRRIESVFTYSNSTAYSAFTCYSNFKVNENLYIHTFSVDEYNPKTNVDKKGILHTNSLIEIKSEEKCKIYKQDIQSNEIIEI